MSTVTRLPRPSDTKGRVAAKIRSLLGEYDLRQGQLAVILGISQPQVSKRLRGTIPFDLDELDKIAGYFGVTVVELLGGIDPTRPEGGPRTRRDSNSQPSVSESTLSVVGGHPAFRWPLRTAA